MAFPVSDTDPTPWGNSPPNPSISLPVWLLAQGKSSKELRTSWSLLSGRCHVPFIQSTSTGCPLFSSRFLPSWAQACKNHALPYKTHCLKGKDGHSLDPAASNQEPQHRWSEVLGHVGGHREDTGTPESILRGGNQGLVSEATGNRSRVKPALKSLDEIKLGKETRT